MKCNCKTPSQGCEHARPKVVGYYCELLVKPIKTCKISELKRGDRFTFPNTPWLVKIFIDHFDGYVLFQPENDRVRKEFNIDRVVNLL